MTNFSFQNMNLHTQEGGEKMPGDRNRVINSEAILPPGTSWITILLTENKLKIFGESALLARYFLEIFIPLSAGIQIPAEEDKKEV